MKTNNLYISKNGKVEFNRVKHENVKWEIDNLGNLIFEGDAVVEDYKLYEIRDEDTLSKIEDKYIKTRITFWKKKQIRCILEGCRYTYKERRHVKVTTSNFTIFDFRINNGDNNTKELTNK